MKPSLPARLALLTLALIAGLPAADYYVSPSGGNGNNGLSLGAAFKTITYAATKVNPGDTVHVADGTYNEAVTVSRSGNASAWVTFRSITKWGAKVVANTGANGFWINANYIEVDGLDVTNPGGHGINCEGNHHIRVLNCHSHHNGNSGISGAWSDFYHFEGNVCNNNAKLSWYSGISIYEAKSIGDSSAGYHIIIRNNTCYGNLTAPANGPHTDGNGIIIDDWNYTQNPGTPYPFTALVENNLCYNNGGAGLKVCWSDNVTFRNNTSYKNNTDTVNDGTYRGDLYCQQSRNIVWANNISWAAPGAGILSYNTAMMDKGSASGNSTVANIWKNNLFFNGTVGQASISTGDGSSPTLTGNLSGVNPLLVNPGTLASSDFHLQATSPAINAGSATYGLPAKDLDGLTRPMGSAVDIGCYEYSAGSTNHAPVLAVAIPNKSAKVGVPFSYRVPGKTFTDADGDVLTWSSNETLGWLVFNASTRTFTGTPGTGDVQATTLTVTVSDGALTASDAFVLTVSLDTTPPAQPAAPSTTSTTSSTPTLSGTTESGATVRIYDNGKLIGTVAANGSGAWTFTPSPPLAVGAHDLTITASDRSNNTSAMSPVTTVTVPASSTSSTSPAITAQGGSKPSKDGGCGMGSALAMLALGLALMLGSPGWSRR